MIREKNPDLHPAAESAKIFITQWGTYSNGQNADLSGIRGTRCYPL